jgi:hypothetical protein
MAFWRKKGVVPEPEEADDEPQIDEVSFASGQIGSDFSFVDLVKVYEAVYNDIMKTGEVPTLGFTSSYREVTKLFDLLGKPFVFVERRCVENYDY